MGDLAVIVFTSLISGLMGSVVGATATFLTTRYSIKRTTQNSFTNALKLHKEEVRSQKISMVDALYAEVKQNLIIVNEQMPGLKFRFSTEAWNLHKQAIEIMSPETQDEFLSLYSEIGRYNTLIDYDLRLPHGSGAKDPQIQQQAKVVQKRLQEIYDDYASTTQ